MSEESYRDRVLRMSEERDEFVTGDDGYVIYWPASFTGGGYNSAELRILADELDRRNEAWDKQVREDLGKRV
jgi:hypothetical protein